jgi:hypothetical protein
LKTDQNKEKRRGDNQVLKDKRFSITKKKKFISKKKARKPPISK